MSTKATFYHAGCPVCVAAERTVAEGLDRSKFDVEIVHLGQNKSRVAEAEKAGVPGRATFVQADIYKSDFSNANVLTMYLLPNINLDMRPIILKMKPGTRVVSHQFNMGDWTPDETADFSGRSAYLWVVPAKVDGKWAVEAAANVPAFTFSIRQEYQRISGFAGPGAISFGLREPLLWGDRIRFSFVDEQGRSREFSGTVNGNAISGEMRTNGSAPAQFTARRTGD